MEKNIDATLDIAKSLKDFESQVTKLLELTNVKEWDGRIFKEREEKIRAELKLGLIKKVVKMQKQTATALQVYGLSQSY